MQGVSVVGSIPLITDPELIVNGVLRVQSSELRLRVRGSCRRVIVRRRNGGVKTPVLIVSNKQSLGASGSYRI